MEGWRHRGNSAGEKSCPTKRKKNPLDSDRRSHGRRLCALKKAVDYLQCPKCSQLFMAVGFGYYGVTVSLVSSLSLRYLPVIKVSPGAIAVATPNFEMVATAVLDEDQSVTPVFSSS
jgi:hypothetical protein